MVRPSSYPSILWHGDVLTKKCLSTSANECHRIMVPANDSKIMKPSATAQSRLSEFRQLLFLAANIGPRILSQSGHSLDKILNGVLACALQTAEFGPVDWHRYCRAWACARRVGRNGRCFAAIAQIVDENALVTFGLCGRRDVPVRLICFHRFGDSFGECLGSFPGGERNRQHNVQAFPTRRLQKALEFYALETIADVERGCYDVFPPGFRPRIEVEYKPVGALEVIDSASTDVNFENASLYQRDHAIEIIDRNNLVVFFRHEMKMVDRNAGTRMLLKKALS